MNPTSQPSSTRKTPLTETEKAIRKYRKKLKNAKTPEQTKKAEDMLKVLDPPSKEKVPPKKGKGVWKQAKEYNNSPEAKERVKEKENKLKTSSHVKQARIEAIQTMKQKEEEELQKQEKQREQEVEIGIYKKTNKCSRYKAVERLNQEHREKLIQENEAHIQEHISVLKVENQGDIDKLMKQMIESDISEEEALKIVNNRLTNIAECKEVLIINIMETENCDRETAIQKTKCIE